MTKLRDGQITNCQAYKGRGRRRGGGGEEGSWGDSKRGAGRARNSKVELMWVVGGWWWYERIAVTVRLRLNCY